MPAGIIAFAKDWHEDPTSNHHVLRELAKTRRVLWLNSIVQRTPKLSSGRDLGRAARKLREFARGPVNVENDLWVLTPLVVPLPHSSLGARASTAASCARRCGVLRRRLGIDDFQLWTFLPNAAPYVGTLGETLSVYYCVDEWSMFSTSTRGTVAAERALLEGRCRVRDQRRARRAQARGSTRRPMSRRTASTTRVRARARRRDADSRRPRADQVARCSASTGRCATGSTSSCSPTSRAGARTGASC